MTAAPRGSAAPCGVTHYDTETTRCPVSHFLHPYPVFLPHSPQLMHRRSCLHAICCCRRYTCCISTVCILRRPAAGPHHAACMTYGPRRA
ncbi:hypothetical protein CENSYa_0760 [Cenarchaeum symbiosum A]|uniref:Uncharacterized protein n=1 Tax=Cenarchaeum symbiosum (strain A) TaxID=414004 RepID=A0RVM6_CENSY|nr:hypothetical protein CENSYa_0760 [Cenarchaeum symbiosum A]